MNNRVQLGMMMMMMIKTVILSYRLLITVSTTLPLYIEIIHLV